MTDTRRLIVMRHAKAEAHAASDIERGLTERGKADARDAAAYLREVDRVPTHAVVSSAVRTVQTWEQVRAASESEATADVEPALYAASPDRLLESIRLVPEDAAVVICVGHNPGVEYLAGVLADAEGEVEVMRSLLNGFPTAGLAVFDVPVPWTDLDQGTARLTHYHVGRASD